MIVFVNRLFTDEPVGTVSDNLFSILSTLSMHAGPVGSVVLVRIDGLSACPEKAVCRLFSRSFRACAFVLQCLTQLYPSRLSVKVREYHCLPPPPFFFLYAKSKTYPKSENCIIIALTADTTIRSKSIYSIRRRRT